MPRRLLLALLMGLMFVCLSAVTIEDLRDRMYIWDEDQLATDTTVQMFIDFLGESTDLNQIDEALALWMDITPTEGKAWLEQKTQKPDEDLKYFYMWFSVQEDALSRINAGRQLTQNFPDEVYGYRLMLLSYVENMPLDYYFDDPETVKDMLIADVPVLKEYAGFKTDAYATLAGVLANLYDGNMSMAKRYLSEAWKAQAEWLGFIEDERLQPMEDYHELIRFYLELMLSDTSGDESLRGRMLSLSTLLLEYYFEDISDYAACVSLDKLSPIFRESLYNRYIIVSSYYQQENYTAPEAILANYDNIDDCLDFQDAWISFNPTQAKDVYHAILANSKGYLPTLLMTRFSDDKAFLREQGRLLVNMDRSQKYGYQLIAESYLEYFSTNGKDAPDRAEWENALRKDSGLFRSYYLRFMEDPTATETYMLTRVMKNRDERAMLLHKRMLDRGFSFDNINRSETVLAKSGKYDLLMQAKQNRANSYLEDGSLDPEGAESFTVGSFLQTFYEGGMYSELTGFVEQNPEWLDYEEVQYMAVDSYYYQERYPEVIENLYLMVDEGTIGYTILTSLEGTPVSQEATWGPLLDYAKTKPDPQADSQEPKPPVVDDTVFKPYPAPDWSLYDAEGNLISLSDLRGSIVILDFWATWCGPCTRTMPLLDEWMSNYAPQNVMVFSINVWEEDNEGAIRFMNDNGYGMHLLFGNDEIAAAYGVEGIPYICLIDEQGMVRFSEIGYNPDLVNVINGWMDTLLSY